MKILNLSLMEYIILLFFWSAIFSGLTEFIRFVDYYTTATYAVFIVFSLFLFALLGIANYVNQAKDTRFSLFDPYEFVDHCQDAKFLQALLDKFIPIDMRNIDKSDYPDGVKAWKRDGVNRFSEAIRKRIQQLNNNRSSL